MTALKEVADILVGHGRLSCMPSVSPEDDGTMTVTLRITPPIGLEALSLRHELEHLQDMAQLRALATKYDIDPKKLEALLPTVDE